MKKSLFSGIGVVGIFGVIVGVILFGGISVFKTSESIQNGVGAFITDEAFYCDTTATTSVNFLATFANGPYVTSIDCIVPVRNWRVMTLHTQMNASTSESTLTAKAYGSYDGIDWYDIPNIIVEDAITNTVGSTTATFTFAPQNPGFNRTSWAFEPGGFKVVKWTTSPGTASSSVWQMAVPTTDI